MEDRTAFDVAVAELLRCWRFRDDLRNRGGATLEETTQAWLQLDRARTWVASFEGAGRQPGLRATPQRRHGRGTVRT